MGVNLKNIDLGEVQPICSTCGVGLCWSIDVEEFIEWEGFWVDWTCSDCNPNYKGAYELYKKVFIYSK